MKIMSFNVCSLRTWRDFYSEEWMEWKKALKAIVEYNNVDIVMLQEVYKFEPSYIKDIASFLGNEYKTITTESYSNCNCNLHNAIFLGQNLAGVSVSDISQNYQNYQNRNNNFQVIKFNISANDLILVNVHLASDGNARIVDGGDHANDLINLEQLLSNIEQQYPDAYILAGGDFNYSYDLLSKHLAENNVLANWLLDDETATGKGAQTTLTQAGQMGNAMDHFIYNSNLKTRIKKQAYNENQNDPWNFTLGVLHVENGNSTKIRIGNLKEVSFVDYHQTISDHFPIITELEI